MGEGEAVELVDNKRTEDNHGQRVRPKLVFEQCDTKNALVTPWLSR
jgi:hypothetical protein